MRVASAINHSTSLTLSGSLTMALAVFGADELWEYLQREFHDHSDPKSNKLSHYIWQRYASSVWDDIRIDNVLPFRDSKEEDALP